MPFKKGQSGNDAKKFTKLNQPPNENKGRPKGKSLLTILDELLEMAAPDTVLNNDYIQDQVAKIAPEHKLTNAEAVMMKLMHSAQVLGDMRAIDTILERKHGKVSQPIDGEGIIKITIGKQKK
jgi:hypothetical protein